MTTESGVKVTVTEEAALKRVLAIEVDRERVSREQDAVVEAFRKKLNLPGFRKGKVPREMARKMLGQDLEGEVIQRLVPKAFEQALRDSEIDPVGDPSISDLEFKAGEPLTFKATVEVLPQVEISGYKGLKVTKEVPDIDEEAVGGTLDAIREARAVPEAVERPAAKGDVVEIRYVEMGPDGEPKDEEPVEISLEVGGSRTPDTFSEALLGAATGDMKQVALPYPADYPDEALAGTTRTFHVTVGTVKEKVWPALDDALAQQVLGQEDATVDRLKEQIRANHEAEAQLHARRQLEGKIVSRLLELNPIELPEGMVNGALERIEEQARKDNETLSDEDAAKLREEYRPVVERRYRTDLMFEALARQEEVRVTEEDVDKEIEAFASREGRPAAKIKAELRKENGLSRLSRDIFQRRILDKLVEHADVTEVTAPRHQHEEK